MRIERVQNGYMIRVGQANYRLDDYIHVAKTVPQVLKIIERVLAGEK